jgi:hypothetical protein
MVRSSPKVPTTFILTTEAYAKKLTSSTEGPSILASCDSLALMRWAVSNEGRGEMERGMRDGGSGGEGR